MPNASKPRRKRDRSAARPTMVRLTTEEHDALEVIASKLRALNLAPSFASRSSTIRMALFLTGAITGAACRQSDDVITAYSSGLVASACKEVWGEQK